MTQSNAFDINAAKPRFGSKANVLRRETHVRFGSKADICDATSHVRFTPNSDRESEFSQKVMSRFAPESGHSRSKSNVR
jgi:hypothetical protein